MPFEGNVDLTPAEEQNKRWVKIEAARTSFFMVNSFRFIAHSRKAQDLYNL